MVSFIDLMLGEKPFHSYNNNMVVKIINKAVPPPNVLRKDLNIGRIFTEIVFLYCIYIFFFYLKRL